MKRNILLGTILTLFVTITFAQGDIPFGFGVRWGVQVLKPGEFAGYPGKQVSALVQYKDTSGIVRYSEEHTGTLDDFSYLRFTIGKGNNPNPSEGVRPELFGIISRLCWTITVSTDGGPVTVMGENEILAVPRSNMAAHALNSERLGGALYNNTLLDLDEFVNPPPLVHYGLNSWSVNIPGEEYEFRPLNTWDFVRTEPSQSIVTGSPLNAVRIGKGTTWPFVFGPSTPAELENLYSVCVPPLMNYRHGLGVKVAENQNPTHNTAAIYADNTASGLSAGVLANAQTWGVFGAAQNGVVGISSGLLSGAAVTGFVGAAPETGEFKYGLYGNSNSQPNSWAAAIFGNGFYTGTFSMSSDERLKTEIRSQTNALEKVMQLNPAQYQYRQDTPFGLPTGLHHGFLAQEVEKLFPELVSDVIMPLDLDPQEMFRSDVTEYKAINYIEMIAILTSAVQELNTSMNAKINAQAKEIEALREELSKKD